MQALLLMGGCGTAIIILSTASGSSIDNGELVRRAYGAHKTCAIVGSSGLLLNHEHGKAIDAHDFVIRANNAPTKGFEKHVGAKTSLMTMNAVTYRKGPICPPANVSMLKNGRIPPDICKRGNSLRTLFDLGYDDRYFAELRRLGSVLNPRVGTVMMEEGFISGDSRFFYRARMSGLWMLTIASYVCDSVSIYGVTTTLSASSGPYHYYSLSDRHDPADRVRLDAIAVEDFVARYPKFSLH